MSPKVHLRLACGTTQIHGVQILFVPSSWGEGQLQPVLSEREYEQRKRNATAQELALLHEQVKQLKVENQYRLFLYNIRWGVAAFVVMLAITALVFPVAQTPLHMGTQMVPFQKVKLHQQYEFFCFVYSLCCLMPVVFAECHELSQEVSRRQQASCTCWHTEAVSTWQPEEYKGHLVSDINLVLGASLVVLLNEFILALG
jgi:hypothetical protein